MVVNYGTALLVINNITIQDETGATVGVVSGVPPIVIEPSKYFEENVKINDENGIIFANHRIFGGWFSYVLN